MTYNKLSGGYPNMNTSEVAPMSDAEVEQAIAIIHADRTSRDGWRTAAKDDLFASDMIEKLAIELGRRHGWVWVDPVVENFFTVEALAGRKPRGAVDHEQCNWGSPDDLFDHAYYFREAKRPYRATAIASHLYGNSADKPGDLAQVAAELGLALEWPADFPSWWLSRLDQLGAHQTCQAVAHAGSIKGRFVAPPDWLSSPICC